jgi:hypothetical protein
MLTLYMQIHGTFLCEVRSDGVNILCSDLKKINGNLTCLDLDSLVISLLTPSALCHTFTELEVRKICL